MSGEVAISPKLVHPASGEILDLSKPDEDLAAWLYEIRDVESRLKEVKGELTREFYHRLDKAAKWSRLVGEYEVKGESPEPVTAYDGNQLWDVLSTFVEDGLLSQEALETAVEQVISYKPKLAGVKAARKVDPQIAEAIDACSYEVEKRRYITIKRHD